jgi:NADH:ubiquinone oxidoreductase subunit F (NADH-binding)
MTLRISINQSLTKLLVIILFLPQPSFAETETIFQNPKTLNITEYVSNNNNGEELIQVRLLGAIQRPGVYHVPVNTDLTTVLSYAGGTTPDATLDNIMVSRQKTKSSVEFNLETTIKHPSENNSFLQANDIVFVKRREPWVSQNAVTVLTVISTVFGIALASVIISQQLSK